LGQHSLLDDPELKEFNLKLSKAIDGLPTEVKDRFKVLKVLQVCHSISIKNIMIIDLFFIKILINMR
jgi:hypothetical protein